MKELIAIQQRLKAPKSKRNTFGNYNYRSCEDILEAVKPICHEQRCFITISDEIIASGERIYIKATATIHNAEGQSLSVSAFAREEETKKGMDAAQITGSASSYARKYALNGLLAIDDTKDPDSDELNPKQTAKETPKPSPAPEKQKTEICFKDIDSKERCDSLLKWVYNAYTKAEKGTFIVADFIRNHYAINDKTLNRFTELFNSYIQAMKTAA